MAPKQEGPKIIRPKTTWGGQATLTEIKTIVTSGKGTTPSLVLLHLVKQPGLDPTEDMNIRNIAMPANIIPSLAW